MRGDPNAVGCDVCDNLPSGDILRASFSIPLFSNDKDEPAFRSLVIHSGDILGFKVLWGTAVLAFNVVDLMTLFVQINNVKLQRGSVCGLQDAGGTEFE